MLRRRRGNKKYQGQSPLSKLFCASLICFAGSVSVTPVQAAITDNMVGTQGGASGEDRGNPEHVGQVGHWVYETTLGHSKQQTPHARSHTSAVSGVNNGAVNGSGPQRSQGRTSSRTSGGGKCLGNGGDASTGGNGSGGSKGGHVITAY